MLKRICTVSASAMLLGGCAYQFGYMPEPRIQTRPDSFQEAIDKAEIRAGQYAERSQVLSKTVPFYDAGLMLSGAAALAAVTFDAHPDYSKVALVTGAVIYGVREYLDLGDRRKRKLQGQQAQLCVASVLGDVATVDTDDGLKEEWALVIANRKMVIAIAAEHQRQGETDTVAGYLRVLNAMDAYQHGRYWADAAIQQIDLRFAQATPLPGPPTGFQSSYTQLLDEVPGETGATLQGGPAERAPEMGAKAREQANIIRAVAALLASKTTEHLAALDSALNKCVELVKGV